MAPYPSKKQVMADKVPKKSLKSQIPFEYKFEVQEITKSRVN